MDHPARVETERRRHERFAVQSDAYAVLRSHLPRLGKIIDVSRGGMSFRYVDGSENISGTAAMDVFLLNQPVLMKSVPVRSCCDFALDPMSADDDESLRRSCVEFVALEPGQASALEDFIAHHTLPLG